MKILQSLSVKYKKKGLLNTTEILNMKPNGRCWVLCRADILYEDSFGLLSEVYSEDVYQCNTFGKYREIFDHRYYNRIKL